MLHRLRLTARRWPRLCLALVLVAFSSQSVAVALDWCLDAVGGTHVANVFAPCGDSPAHDGQAHDAHSLSHASPPGGAAPSDGAHPGAATAMPHCHDGVHPGAPGHPMHHVAATSDGASSLAATIVAVPVAACWQFVPHVAMLEASGAGTASLRLAAPPHAPPRPTLSGSIPGESSRLLI